MTPRLEHNSPAPAPEDPVRAAAPGGRYSFDRAILGPPLLLAVVVIILAGAASLSIPINRRQRPAGRIARRRLFRMGLARPPPPRRSSAVAARRPCRFDGLADSGKQHGPSVASPGGFPQFRPDTWSYEAFSDYLRRFPRGQTAGMPMVDEFGAHLRGSRFASPALLAFLQGVPLLGEWPLPTSCWSSGAWRRTSFRCWPWAGRSICGRTGRCRCSALFSPRRRAG